MTCIDGDGGTRGCAGPVRLRESLSGTGMRIARCDGHWAKRLDRERELTERYPRTAPPDFDPMYAGERWDDED